MAVSLHRGSVIKNKDNNSICFRHSWQKTRQKHESTEPRSIAETAISQHLWGSFLCDLNYSNKNNQFYGIRHFIVFLGGRAGDYVFTIM